MPITRFFPRRATMRDRIYLSTPSLWPLYPYLPVIRRGAVGGCEQLGIVHDVVGISELHGYSPIVYLANFLTIPNTEAEFLALPKIVYDTLDELFDDGWVID